MTIEHFDPDAWLAEFTAVAHEIQEDARRQIDEAGNGYCMERQRAIAMYATCGMLPGIARDERPIVYLMATAPRERVLCPDCATTQVRAGTSFDDLALCIVESLRPIMCACQARS